MRQKRNPNFEERQRFSPPALILLRQWDRLVELEGLVYRQVYRPDGGEVVRQLLLLSALVDEVLTQVHQEHGHQGVERTLSLLQPRCYWPGMSKAVRQWCEQCERCQIAKDSRPKARTFMGHLLASRPNEILALFHFAGTFAERSGKRVGHHQRVQQVHSRHSNARSASSNCGTSLGVRVVLEVWGPCENLFGSGSQF